jgi:hypothetical protein
VRHSSAAGAGVAAIDTASGTLAKTLAIKVDMNFALRFGML